MNAREHLLNTPLVPLIGDNDRYDDKSTLKDLLRDLADYGQSGKVAEPSMVEALEKMLKSATTLPLP